MVINSIDSLFVFGPQCFLLVLQTLVLWAMSSVKTQQLLTKLWIAFNPFHAQVYVKINFAQQHVLYLDMESVECCKSPIGTSGLCISTKKCRGRILVLFYTQTYYLLYAMVKWCNVNSRINCYTIICLRKCVGVPLGSTRPYLPYLPYPPSPGTKFVVS